MSGTVGRFRRAALVLREPRTAAMLAEALVSLAWARLLILVPSRRIGRLLGKAMQETAHEPLSPENERKARGVRDAIAAASRHTFWESKCLARAVAGQRMLKRRGIGSTLYLGTGRGEDGGLAAHAWLRAGTCYVTGSEEMRRFTAVSMFAVHR